MTGVNKDFNINFLGYTLVLFVILIETYQVIFTVKPFWLDEWFIIYNLKFNRTDEIFRDLDYSQQFPRILLYSINKFSGYFNYSYQALRIPSFVAMTAAIYIYIRISSKIYIDPLNKWVTVLCILSFKTVSQYFIQTKHYSFEILFAVLIIYQLIYITRAVKNHKIEVNYVISTLLIPVGFFCSYTYPILIVPALVVLLIQIKIKSSYYIGIIPLVLSLISLLTAYSLDYSHVLSDSEMQSYWHSKIFSRANWQTGLSNIWIFFSNVGAGLVFEYLLGSLIVVGIISSFLKMNIKIFRSFDESSIIPSYFNLLFVFIIILYFS